MQIVVFLDLDDTLFQTARKCPGTARLHAAAHGRDGLPLSFMTEKQQAVFSFFQGGSTIIPVTARNHDAFTRVSLPFTHGAILDFGAVILGNSGEPDKKWDHVIREQAEAVKRELHEIYGVISGIAEKKKLKVYSRIINDFSMDLYILSRHTDSSPGDLEILYRSSMEHLKGEEYYLHYNDNNLSFIPTFISKASAVNYLAGIIGSRSEDGIVTIGMGDSRSDLAFMTVCDFSMMPRNSQIIKMVMEAQDVQRQL